MTLEEREAVFNQLQKRFNTLKNKYQRLNAEADAKINRWRYAEDSAFELRAEFYRRFNTKRGSLLDEEPTNAYLFLAYGYDAQERILCSAFFESEEMPRIYTFYDYHADYIEFAEFTRDPEAYSKRYNLTQVGQLAQTSGESAAYYADYAESHQFFEAYHYDDLGRMIRIASLNQFRPFPLNDEDQKRIDHALNQQRIMARMFGTEEQFEQTFEQKLMQNLHIERRGGDTHREEIFEYEGETLSRIVERFRQTDGDIISWSPVWVTYESLKAGETDEMLFGAARASLFAAIINTLLKFDPEKRQQTRYYNLVLSYDAVADDGLLLTLGIQAQRDVWEKTTRERTYRSLVYNSGHLHSDFISLDDLPSEYARFLRVNRLEKNWDIIRKLVKTVASELNYFRWEGILQTTSDFIVFSSDYEALEDVHDEIIDCVPEHKLVILRTKGLLD